MIVMNNKLITTLFCLSPAIVSAASQTGEKPNVIFILADDLGYGDLGCYGQKDIRTPNLDRMAQKGMRFTDFYAGSTVSAPSRCTFLTGKHSGHAYIRMNASGRNEDLRQQDYTLSQYFREQGYATGMFGKWGLGMEDGEGAPENKGFDEFLGYTMQGRAHNYFPDKLVAIKNGKSQEVKTEKGQYSHDLFVKRAEEFILRNEHKPFFLYLPFTIPHAGMQIPEKDRQYLHPDGSSQFKETPFAGKGSYAPQPYPKATYASMITKMDHDIGQLLHLLDSLHLSENTLVIFTSDNGPHNEGGIHYKDFNSSGGLRGFKRSFHEGGIRMPFIALWQGKIRPGVEHTPCAMWDLFSTYCEILGTPPPADTDGVSMYKLLTQDHEPQPDRLLYWEISQNPQKFVQAARYGKWKIIRTLHSEGGEDIQLYDLEKDRTEKNNIAGTHPQIVSGLVTRMEHCSSPSENPAFKSMNDFK